MVVQKLGKVPEFASLRSSICACTRKMLKCIQVWKNKFDVLDDGSSSNIEVTNFQVREVIEEVVDVALKKAHSNGRKLRFSTAFDQSVPEFINQDSSRMWFRIDKFLDNYINFIDDSSLISLFCKYSPETRIL